MARIREMWEKEPALDGWKWIRDTLEALPANLETP